jgi:hypothetical protein
MVNSQHPLTQGTVSISPKEARLVYGARLAQAIQRSFGQHSAYGESTATECFSAGCIVTCKHLVLSLVLFHTSTRGFYVANNKYELNLYIILDGVGRTSPS